MIIERELAFNKLSKEPYIIKLKDSSFTDTYSTLSLCQAQFERGHGMSRASGSLPGASMGPLVGN